MPEVGKSGETSCHWERQKLPRGLWVTTEAEGPHEEHSSASCFLWYPRRGCWPARELLRASG